MLELTTACRPWILRLHLMRSVLAIVSVLVWSEGRLPGKLRTGRVARMHMISQPTMGGSRRREATQFAEKNPEAQISTASAEIQI